MDTSEERQLATFLMQAPLSPTEMSEIRVLFARRKEMTVEELTGVIESLNLDPADHPLTIRLLELISTTIEPILLDRSLGRFRFESKVRVAKDILEARIVLWTSIPKVRR
jgi:hypothetical protein